MSGSTSALEELQHDAELLEDQLPRSSSKDEAFEIAIKAAETCMKALKLAKDPVEKKNISAKVQSLLQEAERIKLDRDWRRPLGPTSLPTLPLRPVVNGVTKGSKTFKLKEPKSIREISKAEQILIFKASYLNGFKCPPWTGPPAASDFAPKDGENLFLDPVELPLSKFQRDVFDGYKRPAEALPPPSWFPGDRQDLGPSMNFSRKIDLVQDAATDCSVVASLSAVTARAELGHAKIFANVFYPYDHDKGMPRMSANGKYIVRLNFNGTNRRVEVDDRLPTSKTSRVIHVIDRHNPGLLWPALLEKAYLKVRGGYDFPGSNSGTDLWILTGWVPEQVFLQSEDVDPERLWTRISNAFQYGDVLITMGTAKLSSRMERETGLAGEHDYAVLDLREVDGQRLLLVKNPWCEGTSWRGSIKSKADPTADVQQSKSQELSLLDFQEDDAPVQSSRDLLNADESLSPGTFWMDLDNVIQYYESMYLNWNPGLFAYRQDIHFAWDLSDPAIPRGRFASLSTHPQLTVSAHGGGTVWLLLCRHFQNAPNTANGSSVEERYEIDLTGFISIFVFNSNGDRVIMAEHALEKANHVDSPQVLLKLEDLKPGKKYTVVPSEQDLMPTRHTFSLSAFGNSELTLGHAEEPFRHSDTFSAAWTKDTAGGNAHSPSFSTNPQFSIALPHSTSIRLMLETPKDDINVHVKMIHGGGRRIYSCRNRDIVFDSKDYRRGCCVAESKEQVPAGSYTIICSTYEAGQLSDFVLRVDSSMPTQTVLLPREGAGRLKLELSMAAFKSGQYKVAAPLVPKRLVKIMAIARPIDAYRQSGASTLHRSTPSARSLVRLSIELGRGPRRRILIASGGGEYADSRGGIRTEDIDLSPDLLQAGDCWLVLDRMYVSAEGQEERYSVDLFADNPGALAVGVWRSWDD